jgi:hypothetical protein
MELDLSGDRTRLFSIAYDNLVERGLVDYFSPFAQGVDESTPKMHGALVSRLCNYIETDEHCGPELPLEDRQRIYIWIDANVPYYGTYANNKFRANTAGGRDCWDIANKQGWFRKEFLPVFERRCLGCHKHTVDAQTSYYGVKIPVSSKLWTDRALTEHALWCAEQLQTFLVGPELRINLTHPEKSLMLTAPLSTQAGGRGLCRNEDGAPQVFKDTADPDYQAMLRAIRQGCDLLVAHPRADMIPLFAKRPDHDDPQEITGVRIKSVSSELVGVNRVNQRLDRAAVHLVDSSGLGGLSSDGLGIAPADAHSTDPDGTSWSHAGIGYWSDYGTGAADSRRDDPSPWIIFDLGHTCDLERIRIWNYNERGGHSKRGVKELEILVSTDGSAFTPVGRFVLARAPEADDVDFSQSLSVASKAAGVRYVKFRILSNHNGADYQKPVPGPDWSLVGLGEVKFYRP